MFSLFPREEGPPENTVYSKKDNPIVVTYKPEKALELSLLALKTPPVRSYMNSLHPHFSKLAIRPPCQKLMINMSKER